MSPQIKSFRAVIELWGSREALASELRASASAVSKWWQRDSIPAEWWAPLVRTEKASSNGVTAETLTVLARREEART